MKDDLAEALEAAAAESAKPAPVVPVGPIGTGSGVVVGGCRVAGTPSIDAIAAFAKRANEAIRRP